MNSTLLILISCSAVCFSSCALFQPLPLEPVHNVDSVQTIDKSGFSKFNGDYQILSVNSGSNQLDYTFTYKSIFNSKNPPGQNDYLRLSAIDDRHLKATLFVNNKMVASKIIRGEMHSNYFGFHTRHFSLRYGFIIYIQQTNRISLSKEDDLFLDTNKGGIGFLLILPIPLSGSSVDTYNLRFKRKTKIN